MILLLPALILGASASVLRALGDIQPRISYTWLLAAGGALLAWGTVLLMPLFLREGPATVSWQPADVFQAQFILVLDQTSWSFALALASVALITVLVSVAEPQDQARGTWVTGFGLIALSLLGAMAGNLWTLVAVWGALDLTLGYLSLNRPGRPGETAIFPGRVLARILAIGLVVLAGLVSDFTPGSGDGAWFWAHLAFLLAIALRLAIWIPMQPAAEHDSMSSAVLVFALAGPDLVALSRMPLELPPFAVQAAGFLGSLIAIAAAIGVGLFGAALHSPGFWRIGMGGLALSAAAIRAGSDLTSWSVALILSGCLLALYRPLARWYLAFALGGAWLASGLPYSPTWRAMGVLPEASAPVLAALLLGQSGLLAAYCWSALKARVLEDHAEPWVRVMVPFSLGLPVLIAIVIQWWPWPEAIGRSGPIWAGPIVLFMAAALGYWLWRSAVPGDSERLSGASHRIFSLLLRASSAVLRPFARLEWLLTRVLEGEGGVLWAFFLLALLITAVLGRFAGLPIYGF